MSVTPVFLPITRSAVARFLEQAQLPPLPVERAALFTLQSLLGGQLLVAGVERMLMQSTPLFLQQPEAGAQALQGLAKQLQGRDIDAVGDELAALGIVFASAAAMQSREWEDPEHAEHYGPEFQQACRQLLQDYPLPMPAAAGADEDSGDVLAPLPPPPEPLPPFRGTRDQAVAAQLIARADDERIAIDAYAGTGKTYLILALHERLDAHFTYVAPSQAQLYAFQQHGHGGAGSMQAITSWHLLHQIAAEHARSHHLGFEPRARKATLDPAEQARHLGLPALDGRSPLQVLNILKRAINAWCYSDDPWPQARHFRRLLPHTQSERSEWMAACWQLWQAMFQPPGKQGALLDVSLVHLLKWLVLQRAAIPSRFGTLVLDEAHDLSSGWHALLDRHPGGCVLLGDPHQRVRGAARSALHAKHFAMHQSLRMGLQGERVVEQTLDLAPQRLIDAPFAGSSEHLTRLRHPGPGNELPDHGLRIHGSPWSLLEAALRLKDQGALFRLLPASAEALVRISTAAINLYRHGDSYRGIGVEGHQQWDSLAAELQQQGRSAVIRLFERGFDHAALGQLLAAQAADGQQQITLGLLEHARNLEADVVVLGECCFQLSRGLRQGDYNPINAAYLGMTRARHELWLPGDALDRLAETAAAG